MPNVEIEIRRGNEPAETRALQDGRYAIGRESGDIVIGDAQVSSQHGELEVADGVLRYRDLGSTNGSFLEDGTRIQDSVELTAGQALKLGGAVLRVHSVGNQPAAPAAAPKPVQRTMVMGSHMAGPPAPAAPSEPQSSSAESIRSPAGNSDPSAGSPVDHDSASDERAAASHGGGAPPSTSGQGIWDEPEPSEEPAAASGAPSYAIAFPPRSADDPGRGFVDDAKERLSDTWKIFEPHLQPMALLVGAVTVPFGLLSTLANVLPFLTLVFLPLFFVEALLMWFFVHGATADYALRVLLGEGYSPGRAASAQMQRLLPWSVTMLITGILAFIGFFLLILPSLMVSWAAVPAYFVENKRMHEAATRSFELFTANWKQVLYGIAPVAILTFAVGIATAILEAIPVIKILAPLVGAVAQAVLLPYSMIYLFRLYFEVRSTAEGNDDVLREARNALV